MEHNMLVANWLRYSQRRNQMKDFMFSSSRRSAAPLRITLWAAWRAAKRHSMAVTGFRPSGASPLAVASWQAGPCNQPITPPYQLLPFFIVKGPSFLESSSSLP